MAAAKISADMLARELDPVVIEAMTKRDYEVSFPRLVKQAQKGNIYAMYVLAHSYSNGYGVAKSDVDAAKWHRRAADKGLVDSMTQLGSAYSSGNGVPESPVEAAKWWHKAAAQGDAESMFNIGRSYISPNVASRNDKEASLWLEKCARKGHVGCMLSLAAQIEQERLADVPRTHAYAWYSVAASMGDALFSGVATKGRENVATRMTKAEIIDAQALSVRFSEAIRSRK